MIWFESFATAYKTFMAKRDFKPHGTTIEVKMQHKILYCDHGMEY